MRNKTKRAIMLMLVFTMLVSVFVTYPMVGSAAVPEDDKTQYKQLTTEQGQIAVEWESVVVNPANVALFAKDIFCLKCFMFNVII